ncbi:MAG: cytochrome c biogenesis protein ResB [Actinomycetota bacterium]|nr:cytochrome c biogenesis protein ResB [Actinomycetota bacterium]MCL6093865.1 cytochrome c biogenesis protein ResB [Actinomycetota bacterium]MDA8166366.1 cytochrome c biogenesis protein ResB [Actinomycetota bacterium]
MNAEKANAISPVKEPGAQLGRKPADVMFAVIIALALATLDIYLSIIYYRNTGYDMRWLLATIDIMVVISVLAAAGKRVFHMLISMKLAVTMLFVVAIMSIIGTLLPQGADVQQSDLYNSSLYHFYNSLGLFDVYHSRWFLALLFTLIASLILCIGNRVPTTVKKTFRLRVDVKDAFVANQPQAQAFPGAGERGLEEARRVFRAHHYRLHTGSSGSVMGLRGRFAPLASIAFHSSFILIAAGALLSSQLGFSDDSVIVPNGQVVNVPNTQLQVMNYSFKIEYEGKGLLKNGSIVRVRELADGKTVQREDGGDMSQVTQVYDLAPSSFFSDIEVYKNNQPVKRQTIREGDPLEVDGATFYQKSYTYDPSSGQPISILEVNHKPFKTLIYIGGILLMLAIMVSLYLPQRRIWAKVGSDGQLLVGGRTSRSKLGFRREFERMTKELQLRLRQEARADG